MKTAQVTVLGSTNTDLILRVERIPGPGETLLGSELIQAAGGKGANQAVAAKRAGADVAFIGAVGDDVLGSAQRQMLEQEGLDLTCLRTIEATASGVALIFVDAAGNNCIGVGPGANARLSTDDLHHAIPFFRPGGVFITQWETSPEIAREGLRLARKQGMRTILNAAPADPRVANREWLADVDFLIVNETEAAILLGESSTHRKPEEEKQLAAELLARGAGTVVMTLGARGLVIVTKQGSLELAGHPVHAIDTVAAGDTFVGAFACRIGEGHEVVDACRWANRAAAIAVTRTGAQPSIPYREEIEAFR